MLHDQVRPPAPSLHENVRGRLLFENLGRAVFDALEATSRRVFVSTGFSDWFGLERPVAPRNIRVDE